MAHIEIAVNAAEPADAEACFELGMAHSIGVNGASDMVAAHMWFNIAATWGHKDGALLRKEIAAQMSDSEIGCAQKAARAWLKAHPHTVDAAPEIRVAA